MKPFECHPIMKKAFYDLHKNINPDLIGIHGFMYDLSNFNHPGGNGFIEMCKGTDATKLFETHHLNIRKAQDALLALKSSGQYQKSNIDWGSYKNLRAIAFKSFPTRKSRTMNLHTKFVLILNISLALFFHILVLYSTPWTFSYICLCFISSFFNTICGGFGHNGVHRMELSSILLDWNGLSAYEWLHEHIHSHHMYVNSHNDHDAISMSPFLHWIKHYEKAIFGSKGKHIIYLIGEIVVVIQGNLGHRMRWKVLFNTKYPIHIRLSPFLFILRLYSHISYQGLVNGIISLCVNLSIASYYFSALAHMNHAKTHMIDNTSDFVKKQRCNTTDINIPSIFSSIFLFLDRQTLHHLFPTIDHSKLLKLQKYRGKKMCISKLNKLVNDVLDS